MDETLLKQMIGQMFIIGFDGPSITPEIEGWLKRENLGGLIFFKRNIESCEQVVKMTSQVYHYQGDSLPFLGVDQEGGRVARLKSPQVANTEFPPMKVVGSTKNNKNAQQTGAIIGNEVRSQGFNLNFAPVLDENTNPDNPVIGDRSFGSDPVLAGRLGVSFAKGLLKYGVIPCGKHFPGHGDTDLDSHFHLPMLQHTWHRLNRVELIPFKNAIAWGIPMLMTAHILLKRIDSATPATLSRIVLNYLRQRMGHTGVIISDDLDMKAISDHFQVEEILENGLEAGLDIFLFCSPGADFPSMREYILKLARKRTRIRNLIEKSYTRIQKCKRKLSHHPPDPEKCQKILNCRGHKNIAKKIWAIT